MYTEMKHSDAGEIVDVALTRSFLNVDVALALRLRDIYVTITHR